MAEESRQRKNSWIKNGCNAFDSDRPKSAPMSFWTNQNVLRYLKITQTPYAKVYGDIVSQDNQLSLFETGEEVLLVTTGCDRTGCMFCMFGIMSDETPNRFQRMKIAHPKQYNYCIYGGHYENGVLKHNKSGLGIGKILDYIQQPY